VQGILSTAGERISWLDPDGCRRMLEGGEISSGMIPKVESCIAALERGVSRAYIIDGTIEHALLLEVFTDEGVGTMIATEAERPAPEA